MCNRYGRRNRSRSRSVWGTEMAGSLDGRTALVTGAGSGLGAAVAQVFAGEGCRVACLDWHGENARRTCREIEETGGRALALEMDVSDAEAVGAAVRHVDQAFGGLDIAVNCAALDHVVSADEMSVRQWDQVIAVNLRGPFLICKAVWPLLRQRGGGDIVNVASTAATRAWANASAYHASKWGLVGLSRGLGVEGRPHEIRVTTIIPGGMRTHFFDRFPEQGIPLPDEANLQDPGNVARTILFAVQMPKGSALQEAIVTPLTETSWP